MYFRASWQIDPKSGEDEGPPGGVALGSGAHLGEQEMGRNAPGALAEAAGCWPPGLGRSFNPFRLQKHPVLCS